MKTKILLYSCVIRKGNVIQKENAIIQKENAILLQTSSYLVRKRSILPSHMFKVKKKISNAYINYAKLHFEYQKW